MLLQEIPCRQARIRKLEYQLKEIQYGYNELYHEHRETEYRLQLIERHDIWVSAEEHYTISHYRHWIYNQLLRKESQIQQLQQQIDQEVFDIQNGYQGQQMLQKQKKNKLKHSLSISNKSSSPSVSPSRQQYSSSFRILLRNNQSIRWQDYLNQIVYLRSSNRRKFTDMFLCSSSSLSSSSSKNSNNYNNTNNTNDNNRRIQRHHHYKRNK